jgi:hypothetical protein
MRVLIGGTPNVGKSTLAASLFIELTRVGISTSLHEIDVFDNTVWSILGKQDFSTRPKVKSGDWENPKIKKVIHEFSVAKEKIVLGDLPGRVDECLNRMILNATADSAIVVGKDCEGIKLWTDIFEEHCIRILFNVISYRQNLPHIQNALPASNLNRIVLQNSEISQIAQRIVELV